MAKKRKKAEPSPGIVDERFEEQLDRERRSAEIEKRLDSLTTKATEAWDEKGNPLAEDMLILIDAFKRKRNECRDYREHLEYLRDFLKESWDDEEEWFEPHDTAIGERIIGHWCPVTIEELDELLQEGSVWAPL